MATNNMLARRTLSANSVPLRGVDIDRNTRVRQTMQRTIIKQGYLKKLPNAARLGASLKKVERRWFIFGTIGRTDPYIEYYEDEDSIFGSQPLNIIFLDTCRNITRNQKTSRFSNIFTLVLKDRLLSLVAPTRDVMFEWCRAIEEKLNSLGIIETLHGNNDYIHLPSVRQIHSFHELEEPGDAVERNYLDIQASGGTFAAVLLAQAALAQAESKSQREVHYANVRGPQQTTELLEDTYDVTIRSDTDDGIYLIGPQTADSIYMNVNPSPTTSDAVVSTLNAGTSVGHSDSTSQQLPDTATCEALSQAPSAVKDLNDSDLETIENDSLALKKASVRLPSYNEALSSSPKPNEEEASRYSSISPPSAFSENSSRSVSACYVDVVATDSSLRSDADVSERPPPPYTSQKMLLKGANLPLKQIQAQKLIEEMNAPHGVQIVIPKNQCQRSIAFAECFNRIWISGWNQRTCSTFHSFLHLGDQLVAINGTTPRSRQMAKKMLKECAGKTDMTLTIRRIPCGQVFFIRRESETVDSLGLDFVSRTAEIGFVDPTGLARQNGLEEKAPAMAGTGNMATNQPCGTWWITEVNHQPLNLFFKDDEARQRLNAFGSHISFVVQPTQLITEMKKQLKNLTSYRDFLVQ